MDGQMEPKSDNFDEFIYVLSHDVRASVRALAEIPQWISEDLEAEGQAIPEAVSEYLGLMKTHARRVDQMLLDLLTYSRVGRKQDIKEVTLSEAWQKAVRLCHVPDGFELDVAFEHETLWMGTRDCEVMLVALLSNAIKHHTGPNGRFAIRSVGEGVRVALHVSDDGPGIPENQRTRVFEVMKTLRPRDDVEGSGMGLPTVQKIVEFYGGELAWTPPDTGHGTGFTLYFPM